MKIKTIDATPLQLDWLVATLEDWKPRCTTYPWNNSIRVVYWIPGLSGGGRHKPIAPTVIWEQGGPIIEREKIELIPPKDDSDPDWMAVWLNSDDAEAGIQNGPTLLVAAMRCYVASKLGDVVDVPKELVLTIQAKEALNAEYGPLGEPQR